MKENRSLKSGMHKIDETCWEISTIVRLKLGAVNSEHKSSFICSVVYAALNIVIGYDDNFWAYPGF